MLSYDITGKLANIDVAFQRYNDSINCFSDSVRTIFDEFPIGHLTSDDFAKIFTPPPSNPNYGIALGMNHMAGISFL